METWTIVGVVLLAVLVGSAVPVLFQLYSTLRATRGLIQQVGPKLDTTLTELRDTSKRLNRVGSELEQSVRRAKVLLEAVGDIGESIQGLRDSMRTATAVGKALGPALAAAVSALTAVPCPGAEEEKEPPPSATHPEGYNQDGTKEGEDR
jgi:uncharacterized protein YoxC